MERLLKENEAAEYLAGLSVHTLRNWRSQGKGPRFFKIGNSIRYRPEDLEEYIEQSLVDPEKEAINA